MDGFDTTTTSYRIHGATRIGRTLLLASTASPWRSSGIFSADRFLSPLLVLQPRPFPTAEFLQPLATAAGPGVHVNPQPARAPCLLCWPDLLISSDAPLARSAGQTTSSRSPRSWPQASATRLPVNTITCTTSANFYDDCREGRLPPVTPATTEVLAASECGAPGRPGRGGAHRQPRSSAAAGRGRSGSTCRSSSTGDEGGGAYRPCSAATRAGPPDRHSPDGSSSAP